MKTLFNTIKNLWFIIALIVIYLVLDPYLTANNIVVGNTAFLRNDFELTQERHPEAVWDKVFFGNSVVISAYDEQLSSSGYVDLGVDYGVITDIWDMLDKGSITVGSDLVLGINYFTFYDNFETNKTYMWHKEWYEPYAYFERDRFYPLITDWLDAKLHGEQFQLPKYDDQWKILYSGQMDDVTLKERLVIHADEYWSLPIEDFSENLAALQRVAEFCNENGIRLRAIWMPWSEKAPVAEIETRVEEAANAIILQNGGDIWDAKHDFPQEYFHDLHHLNKEVGRPGFTEAFDIWAIR